MFSSVSPGIRNRIAPVMRGRKPVFLFVYFFLSWTLGAILVVALHPSRSFVTAYPVVCALSSGVASLLLL
ncbi:MAG: hypothetical protein SFU56_08175 [Capsulimonadales bacterium]|nr:hypothetical protein [Capsulimonadales bacterium]